MWIRKQEWEEKNDSNRKLLRDKTEKDQIISNLHEELNEKNKCILEIQGEKNNSIQIAGLYKSRLDELTKQFDVVMKSNRDLVDWVNKIITEVGVYDANMKEHVTIPFYRNPVKAMYGSVEEIKEKMNDFVQTEEIIIPEIRFVRLK